MEAIVPISVLLGITGGKSMLIARLIPFHFFYPYTISETNTIPELNSINYN